MILPYRGATGGLQRHQLRPHDDLPRQRDGPDHPVQQLPLPLRFREASSSPCGTRRTPTTVYTVASANYVGVYGTGEIGEAPGRGNGMFFRNSRLGFGDITDGTSQTFFVGERSHNLSYVTWTGRAIGGWLFTTASFEGGTNKFDPEPEESFTMILGPVESGDTAPARRTIPRRTSRTTGAGTPAGSTSCSATGRSASSRTASTHPFISHWRREPVARSWGRTSIDRRGWPAAVLSETSRESRGMSVAILKLRGVRSRYRRRNVRRGSRASSTGDSGALLRKIRDSSGRNNPVARGLAVRVGIRMRRWLAGRTRPRARIDVGPGPSLIRDVHVRDRRGVPRPGGRCDEARLPRVQGDARPRGLRGSTERPSVRCGRS